MIKRNNNLIKSKRSQVTIFVIVAVIIVAVIVTFFLLRNTKVVEVFLPQMPASEVYMDKCVKDAVKEAVEIILPQGGYLAPELYKLNKDAKVAYLCYIQNYYSPCINQEPMLKDHTQEQIKSYITDKIETCFSSLKEEYISRSYTVEMSGTNINVDLKPGQVIVNIDKKISFTRSEEVRNYNSFNVRVISPIYDLILIAQEIVNQEVKFCYFEYLGFSLLYPEYSIEKQDLNGNTKIYSVEDKQTKQKLDFAVRSCVIPPGLG